MADTLRLSFSEEGAGMPVVLLHGFPLSSAIWRQQQQQLSDDYRVITPDLRGHGRSPAPLGVYEMDLLARDVLALLDRLLIKKAVIMGHSMGGYVALAAWKLAPERFLALGLIASQAGTDSDEGRQRRLKMAAKVDAKGSRAMAEAMLPKLFAPEIHANAPIVEPVRQMILKTPPVGIIGALKGMAMRPDCQPLLPTISIPVLILAGRQDQFFGSAKASAMAAVIPGASLTVIERAGHMVMVEQPEATTAAMRNFLSGVVDSGRFSPAEPAKIGV